MSLWEFRLRYADGAVIDQTVIAEGADEAGAAASAARVIVDKPEVALARPGVMASPEVEARWREALDGTFPAVVSDAGRLARYARGLPLAVVILAAWAAAGFAGTAHAVSAAFE